LSGIAAAWQYIHFLLQKKLFNRLRAFKTAKDAIFPNFV
jgi:hypothetical protein